MTLVLVLLVGGQSQAQQVTECRIALGGGSNLPSAEGICGSEELDPWSDAAVELCPEAQITVGYDDNAFRSEDGRVADGFLRFSPSTNVKMIGVPYEFDHDTRLVINRQFAQKSNNFVDFETTNFLAKKFGSDFRTAARAQLERGHEERSNIDSVGTQSSLPKFLRPSGSIGVTYEPPLGFVSMGQTVEHKRFTTDPANIASGRDATTYTSRACVGTRLSKRTQGILIGEFEFVDRLGKSRTGAENDNRTNRILGRINYRFSDITSLQVGAGWLRNKTLNNDNSAIDTFVVQGNLLWRPTDLTRINARLRTRVVQTNVGSAGTLLERLHRVNINHDIHPLFELRGEVSYLTQNVQRSDAEAETVTAQIGGSYKITSRTRLDARYQHSRRFGQAGGGRFSSNIVSIVVSTAY